VRSECDFLSDTALLPKRRTLTVDRCEMPAEWTEQ